MSNIYRIILSLLCIIFSTSKPNLFFISVSSHLCLISVSSLSHFCIISVSFMYHLFYICLISGSSIIPVSSLFRLYLLPSYFICILSVLPIIFLSYLVILSFLSNPQRPYRIVPSKIQSTYDEVYLNFKFNLDTETTPSVNLMITPKRRLDILHVIMASFHQISFLIPENTKNNLKFQIRFQATVKFDYTDNINVLFNKTFNFCKFLRNPNGETLVKKTIATHLKNNELKVKQCPITKNDMIYLHEYIPNAELFPADWEPGYLNIEFELLLDEIGQKQRSIARCEIEANIDYQSGLDHLVSLGGSA